MLKSRFLSFIIVERRENCRIIVGNKTCDVTVDELKKCWKFETVLVSSSLGSLSTRIFETRTAAGREHFAC